MADLGQGPGGKGGGGGGPSGAEEKEKKTEMIFKQAFLGLSITLGARRFSFFAAKP